MKLPARPANPFRPLFFAVTLMLAVILPPQLAAEVLTFQQGVGGYTGLSQTTLLQSGTGAGLVNGGLVAGTWTVDGGSAAFNDGQFRHGLIRFDNLFGTGPGQIPLGSTITTATITANYDDVSNSAFAIYRMLQTWSPATATWNSFTNGVQNDGTEAVAAPTATLSNPNANVAGIYNAYGTSLTADLQLFSNGTSNFGWVVLPTSGSSGWGWSATQTNSPVLSVTFTPPVTSGSVTMLSQNFSTDPINYILPGNSSPFRNTGNNVFWAKSDTLGLTLPNLTGSASTYLAMQNIDGLTTSPFASGTPARLDFNVPAGNYHQIKLSIALAGLPGADVNINFVRAWTDNNGDGTYETPIFNFNSVTSDNQPYNDTVLGSLTAAFQTFANIALPAPTAPDGLLRLRIESFNDSNTVPSGEATGIDTILITGTPTGPVVLPTVALTAPAEAANVFVPGMTNLAATAGDADGSVTKVEFFNGVTKLGEDSSAPYTLAWSPTALGAHTLTAKATDNHGNTATSAAVNVTGIANPNQPPIITLTAPTNLTTVTGSLATLSANIVDPEGDAQTVTFYGRQTTPVNPGPEFTFVAIPDTQFYSENTARNPGAPSNSGALISYFNDQTQWITNNRAAKNIAFVAHMGDMVQNGDSIDAEWVRASGAMGLIENPLTTLLAHGIPWGGAPGNHDFGSGGGSGTTAKWNQYFGTSRWAGKTYFRGNYGSDNNNNYQFFSASGLDFIVINLAYRTTADTAVHDWADALLKAHPNRRAIITSHWIINTGNPATFGGQGQAIYDNLKDNPNLFLLLCGHVHGEGRRSDLFQTRTVHSVLQDYQDAANGGNGFLRTFTFSPVSNQITAEMWSPTLNRTATTGDTSTGLGIFTLPYTMQGAITDWIPLGTVSVPASGTTASLDWTGLEIDKNYEWYATANDSISTVSSATRRFNIASGIAPIVSISTPANNSTFMAPATVNIAATASDSDGSIVKVEFYRGATKIGEDTTAPYEYTAIAQPMGNYTLTAVATDNQNYTSISAGIAITVSAAPSSGSLSRGPYLNQNNQNSIVVRWRSSQSIIGRVRYGDSPTNLTNFTDEIATATNHVVQLTGLTPNTRYYYSVGSAFDTLAGGDANYTFLTSPVPGTASSTRIWVVGDCGRGTQFQRDVRDAYYAWTGPRAPELCLMLGDNAYNTGTDAEYKTGFYDIYQTMFRKMPLWSTLGNHDANIDVLTATTPYFEMFTFPKFGECGGVSSGTENYFSFDYGNIHVINLDSQSSSRAVDNPATTGTNEDGPMAAWLRLDLASTAKTWILAIFHHPPYSKGSHDSDPGGPGYDVRMGDMRANFGPILEGGGVDAVLCGHSHSYERSKFLDDFYESPTLATSGIFKNAGSGRPAGNGAYIKPLTGPRDHYGAVYAVAGSAGSADGGTLNHPVMYVSYNTGGTLNLDINGNRLDATYIEKGSTSGTYTTPDTFTIIKQDPSGPTVTLEMTGSPLAEASGSAMLTATLASIHTLPVTVNLALAGTATAMSDYTLTGSSIVIPAGSITGSTTLTAVQDSIVENPNETVVVDIDTVVNGTESDTQQVTATILDDDPAPTTATLATNGSPSSFGNSVTFTATITPVLTGGTVQFYDNASPLGNPVTLTGGLAQLITSSLAAGSHAITAIYSGSSGFAGSTSSAINQVVNLTFGTWLSSQYPTLAGSDAEPGADPDNDGMTNQEEFAFGLDPTKGSSVNPIAVQLDKATGKFSYTRRLSTGLIYTVWTSPNLAEWTKDEGAIEGVPTVVGDIETVPVTLSSSFLGVPNLFVQVQAK